MNTSSVFTLHTLYDITEVCGAVWFILILIAALRKSKKFILLSLIPVAVSAVVIAAYSITEKQRRREYDQLPVLSVSGDTVTILNSQYFVNGDSYYIKAEEDADGNMNVTGMSRSAHRTVRDPADTGAVLRLTDTPEYIVRRHQRRYGYTFTAERAGTEYVCVAETEVEYPRFVDIYRITADENRMIQVEKTMHLDYGEDFTKELPEKFSFVKDIIFESQN